MLLAVLTLMFMVAFLVCAKDENLLTLQSWGNGAQELKISVPSGYKVKKHGGPDFDVHYIYSENPNDPSMGIYVGHHPNPFSSQVKAIDTTKGADVILGQKVEWVSWRGEPEGKGSFHCETIISGVFKGTGGAGVDYLMIHIFIHGPDQKKVDLLKKSAKSLQTVRK